MASNRPPRDLNSLLNEIESNPEDFDASHWGKAFKDYLKRTNNHKMELLLDFAIKTHVLKRKTEQIRTSQWKEEEINEERREMMKHLFELYFHEDTDTPIALSNPVLREELWEALNNLGTKSSAIEIGEAYQLVWQARCDYKVWKSGIDRTYNLFLASKPSPSLTAVLLSIL